MATKLNTIAYDFGASSGRLILGGFDGEKITLSEIHRFDNEPVRMNGRIYWDIFRLFHEMKSGLKKLSAAGIGAASLGIDTWGVDYGLLDKNGNLTGSPINYRDSRTDGLIEQVDKLMPLKDIYSSTGIQFMNFNTIFQLFADKLTRPDVYDNAADFLMMPDLFGYFLTGEKYNEYTILSTSQLLDAAAKKLDSRILEALGLRNDIFQRIVQPGTMICGLSDETEEETGLRGAKLVAVGSHDTASAVAGTPFDNDVKAFLSCGTWSLLGMETDAPIINDESFRFNMTNEGGVDGRIRFLKNINGLWIIQQLKKSWSENVTSVSYPDIASAARNAANKNYTIDPSDDVFMAPMNMSDEISNYCVNAGQGRPEGLGELAMAVYNGLTGEYKSNLETLEKITGKKISRINMIGGGIQDEFLCSMTAAVTGREIAAGPVEASVLGNIIMQLKALGEIKTLEEGREIIKNSFELKIYKP